MDQDINFLKKVVDSFSTILKSDSITFSSIGTFSPPVLFYAPVITKQLVDIHEGLHKEVKNVITEFNQYYIPNNWIPHVRV